MKLAAEKELELIKKLENNAGLVEEKIILSEKDINVIFKRAWVTFETIKQRDLAYNYFFSTSFDRCLSKICCRFCCSDDYKKM